MVPKHQLIQKLLFYCTVCISDVLPEVRFRTIDTVLRGIFQGDSCLDLFSTKWGLGEGALKRERVLNRGRALIQGNAVTKK